MKHIGLLSDTPGFLDERVFKHFETCDEVWHAGDFGTMEVLEQLRNFKPLRGVYGNIDGAALRRELPLDTQFICENVRVWITHIGGYPKRYDKRVRDLLLQQPEAPQLFICGHSHILKVMYDAQYQMLTMNPGAFGKEGWHKVRTLLRFTIDGDRIGDLKIIEAPRHL